jgi:hypothetical protein
VPRIELRSAEKLKCTSQCSFTAVHGSSNFTANLDAFWNKVLEFHQNGKGGSVGQLRGHRDRRRSWNWNANGS